MCLPDKIDSLIAALEDGCASEAACWQESPWLAGKLALFLHEEENGFVSSELCGHVVAYLIESVRNPHCLQRLNHFFIEETVNVELR